MWCRVLLVAIALTCTFQREIITEPDGQSTPQIDQIKDVICVLLLSGLQKEDLDESLLKKLQRHNVNIDDVNNETIRTCLMSVNSDIRKEILSLPTKEYSHTTASRLEETTPLKLIYNFTEVENTTKYNDSRRNLNNTEMDYNRNKYTPQPRGFPSLMDLWTLSDKTKLKGDAEFIDYTTVTPVSNGRNITFNEENKIGSLTKYFDYISEMFKSYIAAKQVNTTPESKKYRSQYILHQNYNDEISERNTPQKITIENVIYLWNFLEKIKTREEDVIMTTPKTMNLQKPVQFNRDLVIKKEIQSPSKELGSTNIVNENYAPALRTHTGAIKFNTTQKYTYMMPSQIEDFLETTKHYYNKSLVNDYIEKAKDNWYQAHKIHETQSFGQKSDTPKYSPPFLRQRSPLNDSWSFEDTEDLHILNNSQTYQRNITQEKINSSTVKRELNLLPDHIIKEITENLKVSVLKDLQNQMTTSKLTTTTARYTKDETINITRITVKESNQNDTEDYKNFLKLFQTFSKETNNKSSTEITTNNTPITAQDKGQNETAEFEKFMKLFQTFRKERNFATESVIRSTTTSIPKDVRDNLQNQSSVYQKMLTLFQIFIKENEQQQTTTEMTTTNAPKVIKDSNLNESTVFKKLMELFNELKQENPHESTTDITTTINILQTDREHIKLSTNTFYKFMELFKQFQSGKESSGVPSDSKLTYTEQKKTKNEFHGPINVLYPSLLPVNYPHDAEAVSVMPIFYNQYPQVIQTAEALPYNLQKEISNSKTEVAMIPGFKLHPMNNIASVIEDIPTILSAPILQTNADMIPPLGIPLPRTVNAMNQNIIVTTKHPMRQYIEEQYHQSDTKSNKYHEYVGRDYEIHNTDLVKSNADMERSHHVDSGRSYGLNQRYTQHTRPRQSKSIDSGHSPSKQRPGSDFDNFYKDYINNIKPQQSRYHHTGFSRNRNREGFRQKLERPVNRKKHIRQHAYAPREDKRLKVSSRQQVSFNNLKKRDRTYDSHFRNVLKTQQKVNDMLEKILATQMKDKVRSVETPDTVHL